MKRNDMINHMIEEIKEKRERLELRPNTEPYFNKDLANDLLDMLEGFGMLPPPYKKLLEGETEFRNHKNYTRTEPVTGVTFHCTEMPNWYNANEWEPETTCDFCDVPCDNPECFTKCKKSVDKENN